MLNTRLKSALGPVNRLARVYTARYCIFMSNAIRFLGTTDEVTSCDCCGRSDLKRTVAIEILEGDNAGDVVHYGTTCAARAHGIGVSEVRSGAKAADDHKAILARVAKEQADRAEFATMSAFLLARTGLTERYAQVQSMGGYPKARAAFRDAVATGAWTA